MARVLLIDDGRSYLGLLRRMPQLEGRGPVRAAGREQIPARMNPLRGAIRRRPGRERE